MNPTRGGNVSGHWTGVTGEGWDAHKIGKRALPWSNIKSTIALNASDSAFRYENNIKYIGPRQWDVKAEDAIRTDSGSPVVFAGSYETWRVTARSWEGTELFKYLYTYRSDAKTEIWILDNGTDPNGKFRYAFTRDFSKSPFPDGRSGNTAGITLSRAAILDVLPITETYNLTRDLNLISFPFTPRRNGSSRFADIFAPAMDSFAVPFVFYLNSQGVFDYQHMANLNAEAKKGYFVALKTPVTISISGEPVDARVTLNADWNLVGVTQPLIPSANQYVEQWAFSFANDEVQPTRLFQTGLSPKLGYFVLSYRTNAVLIPSTQVGFASLAVVEKSMEPAPAEVSQSLSVQNQNSGSEFNGSVQVAQSGAVSKSLTFGVKSTATDEFDSGLDELRDLPFPGSLNAFFDDGGVRMKSNFKTRRTPKEWPVFVYSQGLGLDGLENKNPVRISWTIPSAGTIPTEARFELLDENRNVLVADMRTTLETSFEVSSANTQRRYIIRMTIPSQGDTTPPTVTVNRAVGQADRATSSPINFVVEFSEPVTAFDEAGISLGGTAGATAKIITGRGTTYHVAISGMTQSGTVTVSVPAGVAQDAAGNWNLASIGEASVTYNKPDTTPPTITSTSPLPPATVGVPYNFQYEATEGTTPYRWEVVFAGSLPSGLELSPSGVLSGTPSNGGLVCFTVRVISASEQSRDGGFCLSISDPPSDTTPPTVTVNRAAGQADPISGSPITFVVEFSEAVTGFDEADVTLGGTAGATTKALTGNGTTYNVRVNGMTQSGTVSVNIPAGAAQDAAGNLSLESTAVDNSVNYNLIVVQQVQVTASAESSGAISPSGVITKNAGESILFTAAPNSAYAVDSWKVNGVVAKNGGSTFTLADVRADATVLVTFKKQSSVPSLDFSWAKAATGGNVVGWRVAIDQLGNAFVTGAFNGTVRSGKYELTSVGLSDLLLAKYDPLGNLLWIRQMGGTGNETPAEVAVDTEGNCYITGSFQNTATIGESVTSLGGNEVFIAKYDPNGNIVWLRQAGGTGDDFRNGIAVDAAGNAYVTGTFQGAASFGTNTLSASGASSLFLVKYNSRGEIMWLTGTKGGGSASALIALDRLGNIYLAGGFRGDVSFDHLNIPPADGSNYGSDDDIYIAKYDPSGQAIWIKTASATGGAAYATSVAVDAAGNSYITGVFRVGSATFGEYVLGALGKEDIFVAKYNSEGGLQWARQAGGSSHDAGWNIAADAFGNSYVIGSHTHSATFDSEQLGTFGSQDIFIAKYNASGQVVWAKNAGGGGDDTGYGIALDRVGNVYTTGAIDGAAKFGEITAEGKYFFLAKLGDNPFLPTSGSLVKQWEAAFGGSGADAFRAVRELPDGGFILAGTSDSQISGNQEVHGFGGTDIWLVRVDAHGTKLWEKNYGGEGTDTLADVIITPEGGFFLAGSSNSKVSGSKTSSDYGEMDFWLIKLDAGGDPLWDQSYGGTGSDGLTAIQMTGDGGYLLGGTSVSPVSGTKTSEFFSVSPQDPDYWVIRIDGDGNALWDRSFGGRGPDYLFSLEASSEGGFLLAGYSKSNADGNKESTSIGSSFADFWILAINSTGAKIWEKSHGGTHDDVLFDTLLTEDGSYLLAGWSESDAGGTKSTSGYGAADFWVLKIDSSGNKIWNVTFGGSEFDTIKSIQPDGSGGYLLGGESLSGLDGNKTAAGFGLSDYWLVRIDSSGNKLSEMVFGGTSADHLSALLGTTDGGFIVAGYSSSAISGNKTSAALGGTDGWIIKLGGKPLIMWSNPRDIVYGMSLSEAQLNATVANGIPGTFTYSPPAGTVLNAGNDQVLSATFIPNDSANISTAKAMVRLNVLKATPLITWLNPGDITYATALGPAQLNATANVPGVFTYSPPAGTSASAGSGQTLTATFTPNDIANYTTVSAAVTINVLKAPATITLADLELSYDGSSKVATVATTPAGLNVLLTYNGSSSAPTEAGTYAVVATVNDANYTGSANGTLVITRMPSTAIVILGDLQQTYDGTPKAAAVTTAPVGLKSLVTYDGNTAAPVNAGSYTVVATIDDADYTGSAVGTLVINKAIASATLEKLEHVYDATPKAAAVITTPVGLDVALTYDDSSSPPADAGTYRVVATVNDANYTGTASGTFVITKMPATVTVAVESLQQIYDGTEKNVAVETIPKGLKVAVTYDMSNAAPISAGSYEVVATIQNSNHSGSARGILVINKGAAIVRFDQVEHVYDGTPKAATATTTPPGLHVVLTYNESASAPINAGSYTILANVNDANYAGAADGTLVINKASATVSLSNLEHIHDGTAKVPSATTSPDGLTVVFTYDGNSTPPTTAGSYLVSATVDNSNYSGTGTGRLTISEAPSRIISLTGDLSFDDVSIGSSQELPIRISNAGTLALVVTGILYPDGFSGSWLGGEIPAGAFQNVFVTFAPTTAGDYNGNLIVNSDAISGSNQMLVSGKGLGREKPEFEKVQRLPNGAIRLIMRGQRGKPLILEFSTDLGNWRELASRPNADGRVEFEDTTIHNSNRIFYRVYQE